MLLINIRTCENPEKKFNLKIYLDLHKHPFIMKLEAIPLQATNRITTTLIQCLFVYMIKRKNRM